MRYDDDILRRERLRQRRISSAWTTIVGLAVLGLVLAGLVAGVMPWTDPSAARQTLEAQGYRKIDMRGRCWGCCGEDRFADEFTAETSTGAPIRGVVCRGWWKGSTIRTF